MKAGSDNFRESSVLGVIERLRARNIDVIVFEPNLDGDSVDGCPLVNDLSEFINRSDIIVANRNAGELDAVQGKVYTRDIFGDN
jgi:UDPglucose 6-dehydrogenase